MKKSILFFRLIADFIDVMIILLVYIVLFNMMYIQTTISSLLLFITVNFAIEIYFWKNSTTLGKYVLKLKVVDKSSHERIGFVRMIIREHLGKTMSSVLFLGYIYAFIDKNNQAFHDKLVNSIVIEE